MKKIADESDSLLESLIGVEQTSSTSPASSASSSYISNNTDNNDNNQNETYQLPVRIGINQESLDKGGVPWIVGRFSPGKQTDPNHPHGHYGVDLKAPKGTSVYPIASGIVSDTGNGVVSGNYIKCLHESGKVESFYGHLDSIVCQKGQTVTQNTVIGKVGESGNARGRGAHLHYQVKINGSLINPLGIAGKQVGSLSRSAMLINMIIKLARRYYSLSSS